MDSSRILVVEDEMVTVMDLQKRLTRMGHTVVGVGSTAEEAIRTAAETSPDMVFMDIHLGDGPDGIYAADRIRTTLDIPVVYLTAYADDETLKRAKLTGPYGYIIKPFGERELAAVIEIATYKHEMEKKLRSNERWLSATLTHIGDGVITTDGQGHIRSMNPMAVKLTGWQEDDAHGRPLPEVLRLIDKKTQTPRQNPVAHAIRQKSSIRLPDDTMLITKNGAQKAIDDSVAPIMDQDDQIAGAVMVFRDVTSQQQAREALRESEERFRQLISSSTDHIFVLNREGIYIISNDRVRPLGVATGSELIGKSLEDIYSQETAQLYRQHLTQVFDTGQAVDFEHSIRTAPDREAYHLDTLFPIWRAGEVWVVGGICHDVTTRKHNELQLQAALHDRETLLQELYHRTKNNMQVIIGLIDLQSEQVGEERAKVVLEETRNRIRSMALVHQHLYRAQDLSQIDLAEYITDLVELLAVSYRLDTDRITLTLDVEPAHVLIDTAVPCGLILNEWLSNAFRHAFPGERKGHVIVKLRKTPDNEIVIQVSDDGIGLPPGFDLRTSGSMGLQTVLGISEHQLMGRLSYDSDAGVSWKLQFCDTLYSRRV